MSNKSQVSNTAKFSHLFLTLLIVLFPKEGMAMKYIVKFKKQGEALSVLAKSSANVDKNIPELGLSIVEHKSAAAAHKFHQDFKDSIEYMEPDYPVFAFATPNDDQFSDQNGLKRINAKQAWDVSTGSQDIIVAVSDTGVAINHPDLVNQIWVNQNEIAGNGRDDDQNGFVDDVHGWNFYNKNNDPDDNNGHGTHVAGIIGAQGDNGIGISGVNWRVRIMPVQFLGPSGGGSTSDAIDSIIYAADNGAHVLNASWGGPMQSQALEDAIKYAHEKGMLVVAAAGNESADNELTRSFPANYGGAGLISVASSKDQGLLSSFSNYGETNVHLVAPGSDILSTYLNGSYKRLSGTSMATPMVAGVAALILSVDEQLSVEQLKNAVLNAVDQDSNYQKKISTRGDLNAQLALSQLNSSFQVWPKSIALKGGDRYQFSTYKAQGLVSWSVLPKGFGKVDDNGVFTARTGVSGQVKILVSDGSSSAETQYIQVVKNGVFVPDPDDDNGDDDDDDNDNGNPDDGDDNQGGGGCTPDANAADGSGTPSNGPSSFLTYLFIYLAIAWFRRRYIWNK